MSNRLPFEVGEWYHCFNRGIEKRDVFDNEYDANRFLMLLYLANGTEPISLFNTYKPDPKKSFSHERDEPIVSVGAFCLMPNHFHLLLREIVEGGISTFMRKVGVAYAMYFNAKNNRVGNLFLKPFRSRHISSDEYFQRVLQYVHCNPAELFEPGWKKGIVKNIKVLERKLIQYPYSSFSSYTGDHRRHPILSSDGFEIANQLPISKMLAETKSYYAEIVSETFER